MSGNLEPSVVLFVDKGLVSLQIGWKENHLIFLHISLDVDHTFNITLYESIVEIKRNYQRFGGLIRIYEIASGIIMFVFFIVLNSTLGFWNQPPGGSTERSPSWLLFSWIIYLTYLT